jgi:hypothetical protein
VARRRELEGGDGALVKVGYNGPLSPEIGRDRNQPDQLKQVSAALDKILALA